MSGGPTHGEGLTHSQITFTIIHKTAPVKTSGERFVVQQMDTQTLVDRSTNRVQGTTQTEVLATYVPVGNNEISRDVSEKDFDENGVPTDERKYSMTGERLGPAEPDKKLLPAFRQYLINHGLANIAPPD
jgi:hypothetical protein